MEIWSLVFNSWLVAKAKIWTLFLACTSREQALERDVGTSNLRICGAQDSSCIEASSINGNR